MIRTLIGAGAAATGSFVLWLILGIEPNAADLLAAFAVAAAIAGWAWIATM